MELSVCNTGDILNSTQLNLSNGEYGVSYQLTSEQNARLNEYYCFTVLSINAVLSATPVSVVYTFRYSTIVPSYCEIVTMDTILFEKNTVVLSVVIRDQWNNTVQGIPVPIYDEEGVLVAVTGGDDVFYNASINGAQFVKKKTMYLFAKESGVSTTFKGTFSFDFYSCWYHLTNISCFSKLDVWISGFPYLSGVLLRGLSSINLRLSKVQNDEDSGRKA